MIYPELHGRVAVVTGAARRGCPRFRGISLAYPVS